MHAETPFVPPAPKVLTKEKPLWLMLWDVSHSSLSIWPDYAFDTLFKRYERLGFRAVLVNDPEGVRRVLTDIANYKRPRAFRRLLRPLGGTGLFLSEGAAWRRQRRSLAHIFTPASVGLLLRHFHDAGIHLLSSVEGTNEVNLSRAFQDTALEAVLRALFSMAESAAREKLHAMVRYYIEGPGRVTVFDALAKGEDDFAFANGKRNRFHKAWSSRIDEIVAERKSLPTPAGSRDLLDLLLNLRDPDSGEALSDVEIRDQCATMLAAGSETTARLMFWTCYLLANDRAEQRRVHGEIAAFPPEHVQVLDDLQNWPCLRNVLLEALRLYPPVAHVRRDVVGPDEICGERITPNTMVLVSPWVLHRHRKFWNRPTAFIPDRFAGKAAPWMQMPAFLPFGGGPRICIGLSFALAEAQIVLAWLLTRYNIGLTQSEPVLPVGRVTVEPSYEPTFRLERV
jgi:cytochrome P450